MLAVALPGLAENELEDSCERIKSEEAEYRGKPIPKDPFFSGIVAHYKKKNLRYKEEGDINSDLSQDVKTSQEEFQDLKKPLSASSPSQVYDWEDVPSRKDKHH